MRRPPSAADPGRDRLRLDEHWLRPRLRRRDGHARTPLAAVGPPGHRYVAGSGRRVAGPPGATRGAGPSAVVRRRAQRPGCGVLRRRGVRGVSSRSAELPNDPGLIEPGAVVEWISRHLDEDAEAVLIGGTGFQTGRAIEAVDAAEARP